MALLIVTAKTFNLFDSGVGNQNSLFLIVSVVQSGAYPVFWNAGAPLEHLELNDIEVDVAASGMGFGPHKMTIVDIKWGAPGVFSVEIKPSATWLGSHYVFAVRISRYIGWIKHQGQTLAEWRFA
jgi:hypothetical protein